MSITKAYSIHCDIRPEDHPQTQHGGTCHGWIGEGNCHTLRDARTLASKNGWLWHDGQDVCPAAAGIVARRAVGRK